MAGNLCHVQAPGGGSREQDLHAKKTCLTTGLRAFIKDCKTVLAITKPPANMFMVSSKAKGFIMKQYGMLMHMPAVQAELCVAPQVASKLHDMLCTLRAVKQGPNKHRLKASAQSLPRFETWEPIISKAPPILLTLKAARDKNRHDQRQPQGKSAHRGEQPRDRDCLTSDLG